jgi:hypothetical protein
MALTFTHVIKCKTKVGAVVGIGAKATSATGAKDLAQAKLKVAVVTPIYAVASERIQDSPGSASENSGDSSDAVLILRDTEFHQKTIILQDVASSYFQANTDGKLKLEDGDLQAIATKYGVAVGGTWVIVDGYAAD